MGTVEFLVIALPSSDLGTGHGLWYARTVYFKHCRRVNPNIHEWKTSPFRCCTKKLKIY